MASLEDIKAVLDDIRDSLPKLIQSAKLNPNQILVVAGLSDLSKTLGLISAGEFRAGNSLEPGKGFTGTRLAWPEMTYSGQQWHLVGINNDVIQFGLNALTGEAWAGGGNIRMTSGGILVYNGAVSTGLINTSGSVFFGSDLAAPSSTSLCVFSADQTYNGESVGAGDILIGDNSSGKPNLFWDSSAAKLQFRIGTKVNSFTSGTRGFGGIGAKVRRTTDLTVPDTWGTDGLAVAHGTLDYDDAGFYNASASTKLTIPSGLGGTFLVTVSGFWANISSTSYRATWVRRNGYPSGDTVLEDTHDASTTIDDALTISGAVDLADGDYIEVYLAQHTGVSLTWQTGAQRPSFSIMKIR